MLPHNITIAILEDMALLETHMLTGGMPDTHRQRFLLQEKGKGLYLLAWEDQAPTGYVLLHFQHPDHHASYRHYPECAYVEGLTTHPDKQRRGIATSLMKSTESYAKQQGAEYRVICRNGQCSGASPVQENGLSTYRHPAIPCDVEL